MSNHSAKFASAIFATILAGASFAAVPESGAKTGGQLPVRSEGHDTRRPPLVLPHRSRHQASVLVQPRRERQRPRAPRRRTFLRHRRPRRLQRQPAIRFHRRRARRCPNRSPMRAPNYASNRTPASTPNRRPAASAPAAIQNSPRAIAPDALAPSSPVASRWPDSSGAISPSGNPRLAAAEPPASPQADVAPAPQRATAPVALAAADASLEKRSASMQMLLLVMAGALALAGVTASLIFRFGARADAAGHSKRPSRDLGSDPSRASIAVDVPGRRHAGLARQCAARCIPRSARARRSGAAGDGNAGAAGAQRADLSHATRGGYFSSWRCKPRTNSVSPVRRSRLSRSAFRIDCTSANASSTF